VGGGSFSRLWAYSWWPRTARAKTLHHWWLFAAPSRSNKQLLSPARP